MLMYLLYSIKLRDQFILTIVLFLIMKTEWLIANTNYVKLEGILVEFGRMYGESLRYVDTHRKVSGLLDSIVRHEHLKKQK